MENARYLCSLTAPWLNTSPEKSRASWVEQICQGIMCTELSQILETYIRMLLSLMFICSRRVPLDLKETS